MLTLSRSRAAHHVVALYATMLFTVPIAQAAPELRSPEETPVNAIERASERQVENLKQLYMTEDAVIALVQHLNELLRSHAYTEARIVDLAKPQGLVYQLAVSDDRKLIVRTDDYRKPEAASHSSVSLDISGIDPYVGHHCDSRARKCWIADPFDASSEWLTLAHEPTAAEKIGAAMAELIKRLQQRVGSR